MSHPRKMKIRVLASSAVVVDVGCMEPEDVKKIRQHRIFRRTKASKHLGVPAAMHATIRVVCYYEKYRASYSNTNGPMVLMNSRSSPGSGVLSRNNISILLHLLSLGGTNSGRCVSTENLLSFILLNQGMCYLNGNKWTIKLAANFSYRTIDLIGRSLSAVYIHSYQDSET